MAIFARFGRLVRGFLSLFISGLEEKNPEALMEAAEVALGHPIHIVGKRPSAAEKTA